MNLPRSPSGSNSTVPSSMNRWNSLRSEVLAQPDRVSCEDRRELSAAPFDSARWSRRYAIVPGAAAGVPQWCGREWTFQLGMIQAQKPERQVAPVHY